MNAEMIPYTAHDSLAVAGDAWELAQKLAATDFVPKGLRGKPEAVLAAVLTGHELGLGPMQALAKIHVIEGRPALAAELMRAIVLRAGHELYIAESTNTKATIAGQRLGDSREVRITWPMDDAKRAKLDGTDVWRKYPRAMLLARATGELVRGTFPDVLAGITYTPEELSDGDLFAEGDLEAEDRADAGARKAGKPAKRTRKAAKKRTRSAAGTQDAETGEDVREAPEAARELPPLPEEEPIEAESEEVPAGEDGPRLSGPQQIAMRIGDHGITDRADRLTIVTGIVGHFIESSKDLTPQEIGRVLEYMALPDFDPAPFLEDGSQALADLAPAGVTWRGEDAEPVAVAVHAEAIEAEFSTPDPGPVDPEMWDVDAWRAFAKTKRIKIGSLLAAAALIADEAEDVKPPRTCDQIAGRGIAAALVAELS